MTPYTDVYDAFLAKTLDDEWIKWEEDEAAEDWRALLEGAIVNFQYPRISLERNDEGFIETLSNDEIQILALYMVCGWLSRTILKWDRIGSLYEEKDFSQANMLDKLCALLRGTQQAAEKKESRYYRSINGKPFNYKQLAGDNGNN